MLTESFFGGSHILNRVEGWGGVGGARCRAGQERRGVGLAGSKKSFNKMWRYDYELLFVEQLEG